MSGTLYLVATPIGNLGDFSRRGQETLASVDVIAAEDTRVTLKLLNAFGLKKPMVSYHKFNQGTAGRALLARLLAGKNVALVTDAGTPAISDPGEDLVRLCAEHGVPVTAIPGCCAAVTALALSGLPTGRFVFEGFLSVNRKSRRERLEELRTERRTILFHEAPHKLLATLTDLRDTFGPDRQIALCRELTKLHEEVRRSTLEEAVAYWQTVPPKGEYVLVVAGAAEPSAPETMPLSDAAEQVLALHQEGIRMKDAVRQTAEESGLSRNELYQAALQLSREQEDHPDREP